MAKSISVPSVPQRVANDPDKFTKWLHDLSVKIFDGGRGGESAGGIGGQRTFDIKGIGVIMASDSDEFEDKFSKRIPFCSSSSAILV